MLAAQKFQRFQGILLHERSSRRRKERVADSRGGGDFAARKNVGSRRPAGVTDAGD
jgi:hypothetical protein